MIELTLLPVTASAMGIFITFLEVVFLLMCLLLVMIILIQRPREQGLGAALGGDMAENFMGAGASDMLAKITIWLGTAFFVFSLGIALLFANYQEGRNAGVLGDVTEEVEAGLPAEESGDEQALPPLSEEGQEQPAGAAQGEISPVIDPSAETTDATEAILAEDAPADEAEAPADAEAEAETAPAPGETANP